MFQPYFEYNHQLVNKLLKINSIRDFIVNAPLVVDMEFTLKREALLKSAYHSTAIEGNVLSLNEVDMLSRGMKIIAPEKSRQEVLNYLKVLKNLDNYHENGKITEKSLLKLHHDVTHHTLEYTYLEGQYRTIPVHVVNKKGEVVFTPPRPHLIENLIGEFLEWLNNPEELNPVLVAGIAHFQLAWIHPFVDGNGRTARALAALILYLKDFDKERFFTLDEYYDTDREDYYRALNAVDDEKKDLTPWLEYFLDGFLISISHIKDQILLFSPEKQVKTRIKLSTKQLQILEYIQLKGQITNAEVQKLFHISRQGAYKDLRKLMDMGLVEKKGGSRSTYYVRRLSHE